MEKGRVDPAKPSDGLTIRGDGDGLLFPTFFRQSSASSSIVGSILLAFWLDAAWARHQEAQEEERLSARLVAEIDGNIAAIEYSARALASLDSHARAMASLMRSRPASTLVSLRPS